MEDFSLYVLDITMNSVRANADTISVEIRECGEWLDFTVTDNGYEFAGYSADGELLDGDSFAFGASTVVEAIFVKK